MNLGKKLGVGLATAVLSLSMVTNAFAASDESTASAPGYGTLSGYAWFEGYGGGVDTSVSYNYDRAILTASYLVQDSNGKNLISDQTTSSRGATTTPRLEFSAPNNAYALYGTHGVQGGSTYSAKAVYTIVHIR